MGEKATNGLSTNGLLMQPDFPTDAYERIHTAIVKKYAQHPLYEHYSGAWNALSYRYRASGDDGEAFVRSLQAYGTAPRPEERYEQEKMLFGMFSNGFSAFESAFYGFYTIGAFLLPTAFPLSTPKDQRKVSPEETNRCLSKAFPNNSLLKTFAETFQDAGYLAMRETRNVMTHRTAPGRRLYVSLGSDDTPPDEWKLNNVPLDRGLVSKNAADLSRSITNLLDGVSTFLTGQGI